MSAPSTASLREPAIDTAGALGQVAISSANFSTDEGVRPTIRTSSTALSVGLSADLDTSLNVDEQVRLFPSQFISVHFDIDKSEHQKNVKVDYPIHSEIKYALGRLLDLMKDNEFTPTNLEPWHDTLNCWKEQHPFKFDDNSHILPQEAIQVLYEETNGEAIITTGVGQHQMWAAQFYKFHNPRSYISSLGLGTMGFGLPSALGAQVAHPDRLVVDIDGDGSFLMNVQELATAAIEKIPVKILLLNNQHLGMVVQWEDMLYESVRGHTILGDPDNIGGPDNLDGLYPNFVEIAKGFGIPGRQVIKKADLRDAIKEMIECEGPYILDVIVPYTEHVLPMIQQGKSAKDILIH